MENRPPVAGRKRDEMNPRIVLKTIAMLLLIASGPIGCAALYALLVTK